MAKERLGKPIKARNGIRWTRMVKGNRWTSKTYPSDSRDNERDAWKHFCEWQEKVQEELKPEFAELAAKEKLSREDHEEFNKQLNEKLGEARSLLDTKRLPDDPSGLTPNQLSLIQSAVNVALCEEIEKPPKSEMVDFWAERYLREFQAKAIAGERAMKSYQSARQQLKSFRQFLGTAATVEQITAERFKDYYFHLLGRNTTAKTKNGYRNAARTFIRWMFQDEQCSLSNLPKNLNDKQQIFTGSGESEAEDFIWTPEEFNQTITNLPKEWKAWLLLMLNCGFTQSDLNELKHSEIHWDQGRIIRKRTKTKRQPNPPVVNYKMWQTTREAVKAVLGTDPVFALLTENGARLKPESVKTLPDGEVETTYHDNVSRQWRSQKKKAATKKPLKGLRKTGSTTIKQHPALGWVRSLYLGHAGSVADKNYDSKDGRAYQPLDDAVKWLGEQFGLA